MKARATRKSQCVATRIGRRYKRKMNILLAQQDASGAAAAATAGVLGGVLGICIALAVLVISVVWLFFPFVVYSKLNVIMRHLSNISWYLAAAHKRSGEAVPPPLPQKAEKKDDVYKI